jgi:hypothetical protein
MWKTLEFRIVGEAPLIMHNGDLADYRYPWTQAIKKISGKRTKTEEDHEELARLEWCGGLYLKDGVPCIPANNLEEALRGKGGPARRVKKGKQAAIGVIVTDDFPIEYEGPANIEEMWKSGEFELRSRVIVKGARIIRTRPMFRKWAATVQVKFNPQFVDQADVVNWMHVLGDEIGICDWRPKFGRFLVIEWSEIS